MTDFNFSDLVKELDNTETKETETGVSFSGLRNKWGSEKEAQGIVDEIEKCNKLIYLDLEGNTLGVAAAKSIGKALEKHPEFKQALWKDLFTGRLKNEIPEALKNMGSGIRIAGAQLTVLDCSDNALGPNGMVGLMDLLKSSACFSLKELKFNNCGLGIGGGRMLSEALLSCHQKSIEVGGGAQPFSLRVFIAGRNRLENDGAKALAKVFATINSLEEVVMPQNGIYHDGIRALSESFKKNENMRLINLNDNTITAKGANYLADAFFSMQKLKEINFGDCLLKTKGAMLLADAIQDAHLELEILNLGFNEIGIDGGMAIVSAVKNKPKIQSIILDGNQFGSDGREILNELMLDAVNPEALGSLAEDESDDEEEGEEEDEDDEENDDDAEVSTEDATDDGNDIEYVSTSINLENTIEGSFLNSSNNDESSICFVKEEELPNTIETFCNIPNPTLEMFNNLETPTVIEDFQNYLHEFKDDTYLIKLVFTVLKCSALSEVSKQALDLSNVLYSDAFKYAQETNQITRVRTFFLIQLGLLKSEEKSFKPAYNLKACRHAMQYAIDQKTFPDDIETTFKLFLERFASN